LSAACHEYPAPPTQPLRESTDKAARGCCPPGDQPDGPGPAETRIGPRQHTGLNRRDLARAEQLRTLLGPYLDDSERVAATIPEAEESEFELTSEAG